MDEARLKRLIRMVEESDIDELEIDRPFGRIRITKRRAAETPVVSEAPAAPVVALAPSSPPPLEAAAPVAAAEETAAPRDPSLAVIAAPMVGTFYAAPAPGAKPYVAVGDTVAVGQVVCIVEAMKLMNEVQSEISGVIREIRTTNGQAVEYGQELFLVAPA
jgi:acetyl-CoA carboxylase biotin carboxyl carrier protein